MLNKKEKDPAKDYPLQHILSANESERIERKLPLNNVSGSESILVVEDEEQVRELVIEMLKAYGYTVFGASNGKDALSIFNKNNDRIKLILTDVVMPEMSGRKLIESLENFNGRTKVIFMSGYTDKMIDEQGILESGAEFIQKPFSPSDLLMRIRKVLDS